MKKEVKAVKQSTKSLTSLKTLIDQIMKGQNHHPKDSSFRLTVSGWAQHAHVTFEFPGKYLKKLDTHVVTDDGRNLEIDHGVVVLPDGEIIKLKSATIVEHQSQIPDDSKIDAIFFYTVSKTHETNLPSVPVIIINEGPGSDVIDYEVFNHVLRVHYIIVTAEKISKRLNILRDIVETRRDFTVDEVLNFAYIAIFVKSDAKDVMEKIAVLFSRFPKIDPDLKIDMHQVLKKMILYHFGDDLEKAKELLYLITVNFTDEEVDKMNSYEREIYAKDQEITRITEEKDQEITRITEEKDQEISRLSEELNELKKSNKSSS
ncbi:hypothetical protein [Methanobrevibacter thaueri]|jgi:hypothetical protein|uniref:hypothetical protein n=1 Tax=Methanobrevibacter thaueri TaxID=190975 RepID=UPI0026EE9832|nr:hypothetical protein [Methanobrevibacter thaueri]